MSVDLYEDSLDYYYNNYEPEEMFYQETASEVWNHCLLESLFSIWSVIYKIIFVNFSFGIITSVVFLPECLYNLLSGLSGLYLVITILQSTIGKAVIIACFIITYFLLRLSNYVQRRFDTFPKYGVIVILFLFEYCLLEGDTWLEIRGIAMVFAMKIISLTADIRDNKICFPTFIQYFGYTFSGANIMFGPWINYEQYILPHKHPTKKNLWWIFGIIRAIFFAIFFLSISNCWTNYFISDANRFLTGYKEALTFRTSHYFICYLSEASIVAAGWKNIQFWYDDEKWNFTIVRPSDIEFPASLPIVVANWNMPMHDFLKKYIYRKWVPLGRFLAILITFVISSFLHGFEIKVSVVLITIGLFHYAQISVRNNIAQTFDVCARIFPCRACKHTIKRNNLLCKLLLFIFSVLTVIHLVFLGVLMDQSTNEVGILKKWSDLYYISFWIIFLDILIVQS